MPGTVGTVMEGSPAQSWTMDARTGRTHRILWLSLQEIFFSPYSIRNERPTQQLILLEFLCQARANHVPAYIRYLDTQTNSPGFRPSVLLNS